MGCVPFSWKGKREHMGCVLSPKFSLNLFGYKRELGLSFKGRILTSIIFYLIFIYTHIFLSSLSHLSSHIIPRTKSENVVKKRGKRLEKIEFEFERDLEPKDPYIKSLLGHES